MKRASHLFTLLLLGACVRCLPSTANAADSLYDARNARLLGKNFTTLSFGDGSAFGGGAQPGGTTYYFGPKSATIRYDQRMVKAAQIAADRASAHSTSRCWHAVKNALVDAHVVDTRPTTEYAKQAGDELLGKYGFTKTPIKDPFAAPIGSVLVYGGHGAGHVEIRTATGFVSDFSSPTPSPRPLIGIFVKPS